MIPQRANFPPYSNKTPPFWIVVFVVCMFFHSHACALCIPSMDDRHMKKQFNNKEAIGVTISAYT